MEHVAMLRVVTPYRLDLTVEALRRVKENPVDVMTADGRYLRAMRGPTGVDIIEVRQVKRDTLQVRIVGSGGAAWLQVVTWMLGTEIDLRSWYRRVKAFPWLAALADQLRGLKPPRYPELWEALCHGIIFQQLSIAAAATIMKRLVERFSAPVDYQGLPLYPFPRPQSILEARGSALKSLGLSRMKASYLKGAARAVLDGTVRDDRLRSLSTSQAASELMQLPGIGPWSAAVILLRGFGRLDTFPLRDTGVAASMALVSGNRRIRADKVLEQLGDMSGLLYFHLLLGARAIREQAQ